VVWAGLLQRYEADLGRARKSGNPRRYGELWREVYLYMVLACPAGYSPRVWDKAYRHALIDEFFVPMTVAKNFDKPWRGLWSRYRDATPEWQADETATLESTLRIYQLFAEMTVMEAEIIERIGAMDAHPDGMDAQLWCRIQSKGWVRDTLEVMRPADQERLVRHAGLEQEFMEVPEIATERRCCGHCGHPLLVPAGAQRSVCESCGQVLNVGAPAACCPGCGATISLPVAAASGRCFHCELILSA
jgi:hypothetical protein